MTSLLNEFFQVAQNYSDLLEGTDWGSENPGTFVPVASTIGLPYSDLLEDSEWS